MVHDAEKLPYWKRATIPAHLDLAKLRPAILAKGERFETTEDCRSYSERLEATLRKVPRGHDCAEVLSECRSGCYTCAKPFCPFCARLFRRWLYTQTILVLDQQAASAKIVAVYLGICRKGQLGSVRLPDLRDKLRQRLNRAGLANTIAVGGIEAGYKDAQWLLHAHVLIVGASEESLAELHKEQAALKKSRPLVIQKIRDSITQISYLLKFRYYHRPTQSRKPFPLKVKEAGELALWHKKYAFEDFLFLKRLRRRGAKITRLDGAIADVT